jgi:HEAT repeat protein
MAELIGGDYRRIFANQCRNYQRPLRSLAVELVTEVSGTVPQRKPLLEFLRTIPVEGFPFSEAEAYASEVPRLLQQLRRPAAGVYLPNVPATLGAIGNPAAVAPLIDFIERGSGRLSDDEFNARRDALIALGAIAAQSRAQRPIDYLLAQQEASSWNVKVRWLPPIGMGGSDERNKMLLISTIYGLGVSGDARAAEALRRMLSRTRSGLTTTRDAEARNRAEELESALAHALATNEVVSRVGIRAYRARVQ